jgi:hypothetical protein
MHLQQWTAATLVRFMLQMTSCCLLGSRSEQQVALWGPHQQHRNSGCIETSTGGAAIDKHMMQIGDLKLQEILLSTSK